MALFTALMIGTTALKIANSYKSAQNNIQALAEQKAINAKELKKNILAKTGAQRASYLASGLTLEGTPMEVIKDTYDAGYEDLKQLESNYKRSSRNIMGSFYSGAVGDIMSTGMGMSDFGISGMSGTTSGVSTGTSTQTFRSVF